MRLVLVGLAVLSIASCSPECGGWPSDGTWNFHWVERAGGTCGPVPDYQTTIDTRVDPWNPTTPGARCSGGWVRDQCIFRLNGESCEGIGATAYVVEGDLAYGAGYGEPPEWNGVVTANGIAGTTCSSTYDVTLTRP